MDGGVRQGVFALFARVHSEERWARHGGWDANRMREFVTNEGKGLKDEAAFG